MSAPSACKATFSDFRIVRGRKVAQLVFELPLEQADAALAALGGIPRSDSETWVGIARLDPKAIEKADAPAKERKRFEDLPLPQQAALRCNDAQFWVYLSAQYHIIKSEDDAARMVRDFCGVISRSDLASYPAAADRWRKLDDDFQLWKMGARV